MAHILQRIRSHIKEFQESNSSPQDEDDNLNKYPSVILHDVTTGSSEKVMMEIISNPNANKTIVTIKFRTIECLKRLDLFANQIVKLRIIDTAPFNIDKIKEYIGKVMTYQYITTSPFSIVIATKANNDILFESRDENYKYHGIKISLHTGDVARGQYYWHGSPIIEQSFIDEYNDYVWSIDLFISEKNLSRIICDYLHDTII